MSFPISSKKHIAAFAVLAATLLTLSGCYSGRATPWGVDADGGGGGGYHWTSDGGGSAAAVGVPCNVTAILRTSCWGCHPSAAQPAMVSYADLTGPSSVPGQSVLDRCLARMTAASGAMPPAPRAPVSAGDIAILQAWASAGAPMETCTEDGGAPFDAGPNPYDTPTVCTSGAGWSGRTANTSMAPGQPCIACHTAEGEGPRPAYRIAGTVYPTAHEPDDCNGANGTGVDGAVVVVTDANGTEFRLPTNSVGNFHSPGAGLVMPYLARVEYQGRVREMIGPQTNGDCNACHTLAGTSGAPGRVMLP
jgi:hypothetical protein